MIKNVQMENRLIRIDSLHLYQTVLDRSAVCCYPAIRYGVCVGVFVRTCTWVTGSWHTALYTFVYYKSNVYYTLDIFSIHYLDMFSYISSNFRKNLSNSLQNICVSNNPCIETHNYVTAGLMSTVNVRVKLLKGGFLTFHPFINAIRSISGQLNLTSLIGNHISF